PDLQTGRTFGVHSLAPRTSTPRDPVLQRFWAEVDPEATIASLHEAARRAGLTPAASAGAESLIRAVLSPSDPPTLDQLRAAGAPIDRFLAPHASPPLTVLLYRTPEPLNDRPAQQRTVS